MIVRNEQVLGSQIYVFHKNRAGLKIRIFWSKTGESLLQAPPPPLSLYVTSAYPPPLPTTGQVICERPLRGIVLKLGLNPSFKVESRDTADIG